MKDPAFSGSPNPPADEAKALRAMAARLQSAGRYRALRALALALISGEPERGAAWVMLGDALAGAERREEALSAYQRAVKGGDAALEAVTKLGMTLGALGRIEEGIAALDGALALNPDAVLARFQRGVLRLLARDFAGGWADYESRWRAPPFVDEARGAVPAGLVPHLATGLSAEDLAGQRVVLVGEQGVGDQLLFASMLPDLLAIAREVRLVCDPRLVRLFQASFPGLEVMPPAEARIESDSVDCFLAMGSLGHAFRASGDFPGAPYLRASPEAQARWAERLGDRQGLRVGLAWKGGLPGTRARARSMTPEDLAPILELPGCAFVSLQHGAAAAELAARPGVRTFPAEALHDFDDLAGLVANLDVVVSVQTAVVHLCGGLGQPCLALLPPHPGWRYMADGPRTPWYGSVELVRQEKVGDWAPVVGEAARRLEARLAAAT